MESNAKLILKKLVALIGINLALAVISFLIFRYLYFIGDIETAENGSFSSLTEGLGSLPPQYWGDYAREAATEKSVGYCKIVFFAAFIIEAGYYFFSWLYKKEAEIK